jgi:transposase InsO family protein
VADREKIKQVHDASRGVYGDPRIDAELRMEHDIRIGQKRVARLMKAAGIAGVRPRKRFKTTIRIPGITPASDLVERQFKPDKPNVLWVADITLRQRLSERRGREGARRSGHRRRRGGHSRDPARDGGRRAGSPAQLRGSGGVSMARLSALITHDWRED